MAIKHTGGIPQDRYPTIAISDLFMAISHYYAAYRLSPVSEPLAIGFGLVAIAASVGVLRFGFSESHFSSANAALASLAASVGLPFAGYSLLKTYHMLPTSLDVSLTIAMAALCVVHQISSSLSETAREIVTVSINIWLFVAPLVLIGIMKNNNTLLFGIALFIFIGVIIGADRHRYIAGVRRENIFHYGLGVSTYIISSQLI